MASIGDVLERHNGLGPGFDFMRIGLATLIVIVHCFTLTGHSLFIDGPMWWFAAYSLVAMFFALSGFLIAASATRLSLQNFLINRALRILPALAVDIVVCALIIGPLVTTTPLTVYFTDARFYEYFLNVTGKIQWYLPGVFEHQPEAAVNASLWTVRWEMSCYFIMSVFIFTKFIRKPPFVIASLLGMLIVGLAIEHSGNIHSHLVRYVMNQLFICRGTQLVAAFIMGVVIYQLRSAIPFSKSVAGLCVLICIGSAYLMDFSAVEHVGNRFIVLPAVVYITIFLGLTPIPIPRILHSGDYSYGVYLYHQPLLKVIVGLLPGVVLNRGWGPIYLALLGLVPTALLATFSWHLIEKPILALRKRFSFVARVRGVASKSDLTVAPASSLIAPSLGKSAPEVVQRHLPSYSDELVNDQKA